jgi:hypothetical protein
MMAYWARCSGRHSTFAPASRRTKLFLRGGDDGGDAGAVHAGQRAELDGGGGHYAAGVAGRDDGLGLAALDEFHRAGNGAILLLAQAVNGLVLHGQDFAGVDDLNTVVLEAGGTHGGLDCGLVADEEERGDPAVLGEGKAHAFDDHAAAMIPAHYIHRDSHRPMKLPATGPALTDRVQAPAVTVMTWRPL